MSLFIFLTVIQAIIAAALVGVVLMQRSEGGGLGIGGNPSGALGTRGAADFLSRSTKWLAVAFVALSIALAAVAVDTTSTDAISTTLDRETQTGGAADLLKEAETPAGADPLAQPTDSNAAPDSEQTSPEPADDDPLGQ
ncbi:MAG: preprotein translocase subunit SecG [Pseudomonadota bacterium]